MLLARLVEYERRMATADLVEDVVPPGYIKTRILGFVELDADRQSFSFVPTVTQEGRRRVGLLINAPNLRRSSGIAAKLLVDKADYALGIVEDGASEREREKVTERHRQFVELVRECAAATGEAAVKAVLQFLESEQLKTLRQTQDIAPDDVVAFRVNGQYVTDIPKVRQFWALRNSGKSGDDGQCLACGRTGRIVRVQSVPIKGIPGGQTSGTALVSFNKPAFESHGLSQSFNAPVCDECDELYAKALNRLISGEDTSIRVPPICYVFWSREPSTFSPARLLSRDPEPKDVKALYEATYRGRQPASVSPNAFYGLGLSASGGRAVVRDWLETTVEEAQTNVARFFRLQHIVPSYGQEPRDFSIYTLARSLVPYRPGRRQQEEPPSHLVVTLLHMALGGGQLPDWLLYQAVKRNRAERVSWQRASLMKLVLQSQDTDSEPNEEGTMDTKTQESPAYLCGRLLAVLEYAQQAAVNPKATLVDRFYGAASSAPASVFGNLLRNAQNHLGDLRKNKPGLHNVLQREMEDVLSKLSGFPSMLNMRDQAVFALGYYYQRARRWADRARDVETSSADSAA